MRGRRAGALGLAVLLAVCLIAGIVGLLATTLRDDSSGDALQTPTAEATSRPRVLSNAQTDAAAPARTPGAAEAAVGRVAAGVVTVVREEQRRGSGAWTTAATGTGFVIDEDGHVVTTTEVITGEGRVVVLFPDGSGREAEIVGSDPMSDLAVVRVAGAIPATLAFGDSSRLRPGQPVLAIGSPLGSFTSTVTQGVVSALGRSLAGEAGQPDIGGLIQHDAAINSGNAGGPLLDLEGQVVGVNTRGIQETASGEITQGLFFAIPSNTVARVVDALIQKGVMRYPYLGVETVPVTPALAAQSDLPVERGALVIRTVAYGPAERAGIEAGDVLLAIGDQEIGPRLSFTDALFAFSAGERVTVRVDRGGEALELAVTLAERPAEP